MNSSCFVQFYCVIPQDDLENNKHINIAEWNILKKNNNMLDYFLSSS